MVKRKRAAVLPNNRAALQNLIRRDPTSYREEFRIQLEHYEATRNLFLANPELPEQEAVEFAEQIGFISQMCTCYPEDTKTFPEELADMLKEYHHELPADLKEKMVQSLTMLRNKGVIKSEQLIHTLFPLLVATDSKAMRTQIYSSLITLMKTENKTAKNPSLNKSLQSLLFNLLTDRQSNGLWATKITRELWKRAVWDDARTVEIMCLAALDVEDLKVATSAARFFLSVDQEREDAQNEDNDDENLGLDLSSIKHQGKVNKKSAKREKKLEAIMSKMKKKRKPNEDVQLNFAAIHLLNNPQGFAEKLFSAHFKKGDVQEKQNNTVVYRRKLSLEQKILFIKLISRLVGNHELILLELYSFFDKYLTLKQKDVTQFLAAAAEACHPNVPEENIQPVVKKIANEFVSDGVSAEACAAGLNTIAEIAKRNPASVETDLLHDLVAYKYSKGKSVQMAGRKLVAFYREVDPARLPRKELGKIAALKLRDGATDTSKEGLEGFELLMKHNEENPDEDEEDKDGWEVASDEEDDSDDEGEWVNVESEGEYEISDSDDDDEEGKEAKKQKVEVDANSIMQFASERILTPADFAKMEQLKTQAGMDKLLGRTKQSDEHVDADTLQGPKKFKQTREERIAAAKEGREDREFGSKRGRKLAEKDHSTTNKQKARKKNFMMMVHKRDVQGKAKRSLRDKQKVLRAHITKQKKQKGGK